MLRSMAAASATKAAASSVHVTCCTPTSTSGLLHFPTPSTVDDITNPLRTACGKNQKSEPDPDPGLDPEPDIDHDPDPKSKLPCGLVRGVGVVLILLVMSIVNFPPFFALMVELATVIVVLLVRTVP